MRVLVLDDQRERHDGFVIHFAGHEVVSVYRYTDCLNALRNNGPWDIVCLDHDLADADVKPDFVQEGIAGRYYFTGMDVAVWLRDNRQFCPPKVLIHSWNPDGARSMEAFIRGVPGVNVVREQYRAPIITVGKGS